MPNTGNKLFANKRRWMLDIDNPYATPITPDTALKGTHSYYFQIYIERNCDIEIYLDKVGDLPSASPRYTINYITNGSVQNVPVTIGNIVEGDYNFRFKIVDLVNSYEVGAYIDGGTPTSANIIGDVPYFSPVVDELSCPVGAPTPTTTTTTTTTTTSTTTTTTTLPCTLTGTVTAFTVPDPTTTTTTTTTTTISGIGSIYVDSINSNQLPITGITVNGVPVTYVAGKDFPVSGGQSGYFNTTEIGSYQIVVSYGSHTSGQNIVVDYLGVNEGCYDTNTNSLLSPSGGTLTQTINTGLGELVIVAADGDCI